MPTFAELQAEFFATQLGLNQPWPSVSDMQYLFFLGVKNGDITLGGADPAEVQVIVDSYFSENPPTVSATGLIPEMLADSSTTFPLTRAAFIAANFPGYVGPIRYNSARYLDHPAPPDYQAWDYWRRRRTV